MATHQSFPIIFVHYGNSPYLNYVLKCARHFNRNKRIILIGDELNKHYGAKGIEHYFFRDFMVSGLTMEFQERFFILNEASFFLPGKDDRYTKGIPGHFWQRFNWLRYFILLEFWERNQLSGLWTFDSDNMIVYDLEKLEPALEKYDYCALHEESSMQGLLRNVQALHAFCRKMNDIFKDDALLDLYKGFFKNTPNSSYTFTEMAAFSEFQHGAPYYFLNGCVPFEGKVFDAALPKAQGFQVRDYANSTLQAVKKIFFGQGGFYFREEASGVLIRVINIDCSWVPVYVVENIYQRAISQNARNEPVEVLFRESVINRVRRFVHHYFVKPLGKKLKK